MLSSRFIYLFFNFIYLKLSLLYAKNCFCHQFSHYLTKGSNFFHLKVAQEFYNSIRGKKPEKVKIIVSSHNYENTPTVEEIGNLVATIQATGADIVKVATTAVEITDNARIFQVLVHSQVSICYGKNVLPFLSPILLTSFLDTCND